MKGFQLLVDQIQDFAIFLVSPDGHHQSWNPGVQRILGFTSEEFIGQPVSSIFTPEDVARGVPAAELEVARATGAANDDRWMQRKDGSRLWASGITTSLRDEGGELIGYGKVLRDLTHQRLLQDRLEESDNRLRVALSAAQIGTWRRDLRTGTDTLDASLAGMLGFGDRDATVTLDEFFERVHPDDLERTRAAFERAASGAEPLRVEFRVERSDGSVRWLRHHGEAIADADGAPLYLTGAVVDVTERRESEERLRQSHRMDAVGKLAGGVAHEVNNMMSVVLGFTEFLFADCPAGDSRRHDLEQVRTAAGRAATVTAQLLAFSRRQMLQPTVLDLTAIVSEMAPVLTRLLGEDRELIVQMPAQPLHTKADQAQLEQIIVNLALNARDAMESGDRLTIEVGDAVLDGSFAAEHPEMNPVSGRYVVLSVSDTGHGMDAATLARIYEPFFTTKPTGQGAGLGLAVVHGTVNQSGGHIIAESEPGRGTTFRIYLPAVAPSGERKPSRATAAERPDTGETILVVEDEPMVRRLVVRMLERLGYRCLEAGEGQEAVGLLQAANTDVSGVITDLVMPRMNGRELGEQLGRIRPGVPILYMSGYTDDEMIRRNLLDADAPFIQKPFTAALLAAKLEALIPMR